MIIEELFYLTLGVDPILAGNLYMQLSKIFRNTPLIDNGKFFL